MLAEENTSCIFCSNCINILNFFSIAAATSNAQTTGEKIVHIQLSRKGNKITGVANK